MAWNSTRDRASVAALGFLIERDQPAILLPVGALEQHGPHLPLGTDGMLSSAVAADAAARIGALVVNPEPEESDVVGMGMALAAIRLANRGSTASHRTFGWYRLEILAALANAILLTAVGVYVVVEAILRIGDPVDRMQQPPVQRVLLSRAAWVGIAEIHQERTLEGYTVYSFVSLTASPETPRPAARRDRPT